MKKYGVEKLIAKKIGEIFLFSTKPDLSNAISSQRTLYELYENKKERIYNFELKYFFKKKFPFLLKIIIADDNLPIQVHPKGKNEHWIVRTEHQSKILLSTKYFVDINPIITKRNDYYFFQVVLHIAF